jgi:integrase
MIANGPVTLSDAIEEFLAYRKAAGLARNTLLVNKRGLSAFLALVGNIQVRHMDARHGEMYQAYLMSKGYKPNTVNTNLTTFTAFVKWLRSRRYLRSDSDPAGNVRQIRAMVEPRRRIPKDEFPAFLDHAKNAHERIVCALGLYLFLRTSEISALKVGDVNLTEGTITVRVQKSQIVDPMPISSELDKELRDWLTWYAQDIDEPLNDDMWLVPTRRRPAMGNDGTGPGGGYMIEREHGNCEPYNRLRRASRYVQKVLVAYGVPLRGEDGESKREGCHTLRRSGARALFDELVENAAYDGALRLVSSMLHHKSTIMTERYLGLDVDRKKRNDLLRGKKMFTYAEDVIAASPNVKNLGAKWLPSPVESKSATSAAT